MSHEQTAPRFVEVPFPLTFNDWLDPPIGYDMSQNSVDVVHPRYRVRIMTVVESSLQIPFTEFIEWLPFAPSPDIWQFQTVGVPPQDSTSPKFYTTMTVNQGPPGFARVRSRVFILAQSIPTLPNWVDSTHLGNADHPFISVTGVPDQNGNPLTVRYRHKRITDQNVDPGGPRDIFIQQLS